jgi:ribonucleoside-diphosphate reductase alpha chain
VTDYVFRYLGNRFLKGEPEVADEQEAQTSVTGLAPLRAAVAGGSGAPAPTRPYAFVNQADAPSCSDCGAIMVRNGACYKCANCGGTSGCS